MSEESRQIIKRARSQGYLSEDGQNITSQLMTARNISRDSRAMSKLQANQSQSFLGGNAKNSDRYAAIRLHREFEKAVTDLKIGEEMTKPQLQELFTALGYLRPASKLTSEFTVKENSDLLDKLCKQLAPDR